MAAIVAAIVVGAATLLIRSRASLLAAATLSLSVLAGFVLSRTTGLPNATDDIGNWTEALGLTSMFVEASTALATLAALLSTAAPPATAGEQDRTARAAPRPVRT